jgi:hypothetical protein
VRIWALARRLHTATFVLENGRWGMARKTIIASLIAIPAVALLVYIFLSVWYSPAIRGQVVDASTGEPIASAVLVATWEISSPWEGFVLRQLAVRESATDADGRFELAAWGPRSNFGVGSVRGNQPNIRIWADGYVPRLVSNTPERTVPRRFAFPIIFSRHDGEVLRVAKANTADSTYLWALEGLAQSMEFAYRGERCEWREVPQMLVALHKTKASMESERSSFLRPVGQVVVRAHCGDPVEFFRGYLP